MLIARGRSKENSGTLLDDAGHSPGGAAPTQCSV